MSESHPQFPIPKDRSQFGVSPTKVRKVPQDSRQLLGRKGFW